MSTQELRELRQELQETKARLEVIEKFVKRGTKQLRKITMSGYCYCNHAPQDCISVFGTQICLCQCHRAEEPRGNGYY